MPHLRNVACLALALSIAACSDTDAPAPGADAPAATPAPAAPLAEAPPAAAAPAASSTPAPTPVTGERIAAADSEPGNWLSHGRTYYEQRYSPLDQINADNVKDLKLAWFYDFDTHRGVEATPLSWLVGPDGRVRQRLLGRPHFARLGHDIDALLAT